MAAAATLLYLLTMDRSASWWDCGEFIATGYYLQVGHAPGAPFYQLLQHLMMLLSMGNRMAVAPLSNALSAIAAGATVGVLYLTMCELHVRPAAAALAAACYAVCDTAWFSAVESEVYALAMLFCATDVWLMLRWLRKGDGRRLVLLGLLIGLGVCVHLMTLLTLPALLLIYVRGRLPQWRSKGPEWAAGARCAAMAAMMMAAGLTPYAIVPIRAAAGTPINEMGESFEAYLRRDVYAKAPLYPRMWRERDHNNWAAWTIDGEGLGANAIYYLNYQLGYMYSRYLMYNYVGRENDKWHCVVLFVLPALAALWGIGRQWRRRRSDFWVVAMLFLMGGVVLNAYLNHPCYEPRSRDYVYVLSFYAVALWIGVGMDALLEKPSRWMWVAAVAAPLLMFAGNLSDHNRSRCHSVHDISLNHLQSCDYGAVLITLGDNDTFPLWYLQQVEGRRCDVEVHNIGLTGYANTMNIIAQSLEERPVYVSQYFYDRYGYLFEGQLRCEGFCWRIVPNGEEVSDTEPLRRHIADSIEWHTTKHEYQDPVSRHFMRDWQRNTKTGNR